MPGKLRTFSGKEVVAIFIRYGCTIARTTGNHVRIAYHGADGGRHITVPLHRQLKKGTLRGIAHDFEFCFGHEACRREFYTE